MTVTLDTVKDVLLLAVCAWGLWWLCREVFGRRR